MMGVPSSINRDTPEKTQGCLRESDFSRPGFSSKVIMMDSNNLEAVASKISKRSTCASIPITSMACNFRLMSRSYSRHQTRQANQDSRRYNRQNEYIPVLAVRVMARQYHHLAQDRHNRCAGVKYQIHAASILNKLIGIGS
jgi:hypothetical protein